MKIFVGLGNPGKEYEDTYHNAGCLALLVLAQKGLGGKSYEVGGKKYKDLFEYVEAPGMVFIRPLTYMNESGRAVREALKKFKAKPEDLVVLHDDSDILVGDYKISVARNSAGHKGVQSIIDSIKTNAFTRVRIGIRPKREKVRQKAGEFALKKITSADKKAFTDIFSGLASIVVRKNNRE